MDSIQNTDFKGKVVYFFQHYAVYAIVTVLLLLLFRGVWSLIFKPDTQVNKPVTIVTPFAKVEKGAIDQSNTQIKVEGEKPWEFGGGLLVGQYDNKNFYGGLLTLKRRY